MLGFLTALRLSFTGTIREPALFVVLGASLILLFLAPLGTVLGFHEQESLVRDIGLSTLFLSGILTAMITAGAGETRRAATRLLVLRPVGRAAFYAGTCAGALVAALGVNVTVGLYGFVILRHRAVAFADRDAFLSVGGAALLAVLWGAFRNYRSGRSFVANALGAALVLSVLAALAGAFRGPDGRLRGALPVDDVLLIQTQLLCLFMAVAIFAAVWAGTVSFGRIGGMLAGWAVIGAGIIKESLSALPAAVGTPIEVLVPNLGLVWGGDLFYADLLTLPWAYVWSGCLYLAVWSSAALVTGLAVFLCRRASGLEGAGVRTGA